ncbi:ornithine cyclodeaminase family protein [Streptomyces luteolus]|uniref:Ornithine cyclodeaminase family protein n=1 Tax=Streptomyces luteolus TaxID=3043615 RepID=A0ABT6SZ31_9ACTN|nr:ornithine cyclodeaminase family protein [Streptomyces sp. B-S-A12]MDI3420383.1 ornithine cyclodeaminase family protein [Streptomyces sp. B-S-A12]
MTLPQIDGDELLRHVPMHRAIEAIEQALLAGLDPEADLPRTVLDIDAGQLLLMPSTTSSYTGVKIAGVVPGNPARGLPRIVASYLLLGGATLSPVALVDGAALTLLRTPAVSAVAVKHLAIPEAKRLVVFGAGPQAWAHVEAIRAVRPLASVGVVARRPEQAVTMVERCRAADLDAEAVSPDAVSQADIVACCTTSRTPLFPSSLVAPHTTVVAIGAHEATAREVDTGMVSRATVVVEARTAAMREAGDLLIPLGDGQIGADVVAGNLAELVNGSVETEPSRPRLFKSVGMPWQDLVVAVAAVG